MAALISRAPVEVHHEIPRQLLAAWDRGHGPLFETGEDLQDWLDWTIEAHLYGVDPDISREDLAALVEASAVELARAAHRDGHRAAGDFARWGRRGGLATLALYGREWFRLLAKRRWGRIGADELADAFENGEGRS